MKYYRRWNDKTWHWMDGCPDSPGGSVVEAITVRPTKGLCKKCLALEQKEAEKK